MVASLAVAVSNSIQVTKLTKQGSFVLAYVQ